MSAQSTDTTARQARELSGVILDACDCVDELLVLLEQERDALTLGDVDAITTSAQQKVDCVTKLEQLDNTRADLCRALSLSNDDIEDYLTQQVDQYQANSWHNLLVRLEECRDSNAVNGSVTRARRAHIEKALQILRSGQLTPPALYGPDGLEHTGDVTNLGQA